MTSREARERVLWTVVWLAVVLAGVKAYYLGLPAAPTPGATWDYLRAWLAISYIDVLFAAMVWSTSRLVLVLLSSSPRSSRIFSTVLFAFSAFCCVYAVAGIVIFWIFGGFLSYSLLTMVGDVPMVRSSVGVYVTPSVVAALIVVPLLYVAGVRGTPRLLSRVAARSWIAPAIGLVALVWIVSGHVAYNAEWLTRSDRRVADNPHWALVTSWWRSTMRDGNVRMADPVIADDLAEFEPPQPAAAARPVAVRRVVTPARVPLNVVVIVLESVGARWAGLNGGLYNTTPNLAAESSRGVVFDNFYAHIGRSSNSLAAILFSLYPKLGFHDLTEEYPRLEGTSLAATFHDRGYRTAFMTPSDLSWAGWNEFLEGRGFDDIDDFHDLMCADPISSWGVEDRCMLEGIMSWIDRDRNRPFFVMGWTTQTHHPYEPTPDAPVLDFKREPLADDYDLQRYLNVLHETDRHLGRLFEGIRRAGLADRTLVVVTGDHGQAFGYPHSSYMQGRALYEEDVHVPLLFWQPSIHRTGAHARTIGSHVDLAPTIANLAGFDPAADWQGRSLFDPEHPPRAYFYVAEDNFILGVRENNWKYSIDLRDGTEELYDLDRDSAEQHNLAQVESARCTRLRQRLAAWTEANRRRFENGSVTQ